MWVVHFVHEQSNNVVREDGRPINQHDAEKPSRIDSKTPLACSDDIR
jgi:hypothetical protein